MSAFQFLGYGFQIPTVPGIPNEQSPSDLNTRDAHLVDASMQPPPAKRSKKATTLNAAAWVPHKDRVLQLHIEQGFALKDVARMMKEERGFEATERQYRTRISQWKQDKNVKTGEMKAIVRKRQYRKIVESAKLPLQFNVRGRVIADEHIDRWMKRNHVSNADLYREDTEMTTPSAIDSQTVASTGTFIMSPPPMTPGTPSSFKMQLENVPQSISSPTSLLLREIVGSPISVIAGRSPVVYDADSVESGAVVDASSEPFRLTEASSAMLDDFTLTAPLSQEDKSSNDGPTNGDDPIQYVRRTHHLGRFDADEELCLLQNIQDNEKKGLGSSEECLMTMVKLAAILHDQARDRTATAVLKHSIHLSQHQSPPCIRAVKHALSLLGGVLSKHGQFEHAEVSLRKAISLEVHEGCRSDQEIHLKAKAQLGFILYLLEKDEEAELLSVQVLQLFTNAANDNSSSWPTARVGAVAALIGLFMRSDRLEAAEELIDRVLLLPDDMIMAILSAHASLLWLIVKIYRARDREIELEKLLEGSIHIAIAIHGANSGTTLNIMEPLAGHYQATERPADAEFLLRQVVNGYSVSWGSQHPMICNAMTILALSLGDQRKWEEANRLGAIAVDSLKVSYGSMHIYSLEAMANLGSLYQKQSRLEEACRLLETAYSGIWECAACWDHLCEHRTIKSLIEIYTAQERWVEVGNLRKVEGRLPAWRRIKSYSR